MTADPAQQVAVRKALIAALRADLVGPMAADEVIESRPSRWYLAGFLVPEATPLADRQDPEQAEAMSIDADQGDDPRSIRQLFKPSLVEISPACATFGASPPPLQPHSGEPSKFGAAPERTATPTAIAPPSAPGPASHRHLRQRHTGRPAYRFRLEAHPLQDYPLNNRRRRARSALKQRPTTLSPSPSGATPRRG